MLCVVWCVPCVVCCVLCGVLCAVWRVLCVHVVFCVWYYGALRSLVGGWSLLFGV